jgi:hypothetical protein
VLYTSKPLLQVPQFRLGFFVLLDVRNGNHSER